MLTTARGRTRRRGALLVSGAAAVMAAGSFVVTVDAAGVSISGAMEGRIYLVPFASLSAGLAVSLPAGHPAATVTVASAQVTVVATCGLPFFTGGSTSGGSGATADANGGHGNAGNQGGKGHNDVAKLSIWTETVTVSLPGGSFAIGAGDTSWQPGNAWQASTALSTLCHGLGGWSEQGAGFSATVTSSDPTRPVFIRFHYAEGTPGTWSSTAIVPASTPPTPPPTPTPTPTPTPAPTDSGSGGNTGSSTPTPGPTGPTPGGGTSTPPPSSPGAPGSSGGPGSPGSSGAGEGTQPIRFQPGAPSSSGGPGSTATGTTTAPAGTTLTLSAQPTPSSTPTGGVAGVASGPAASGHPSTSPGGKPGALSTAVTTINNSVLDAAAPVGRIATPIVVVLLGLLVLGARLRRSRPSD